MASIYISKHYYPLSQKKKLVADKVAVHQTKSDFPTFNFERTLFTWNKVKQGKQGQKFFHKFARLNLCSITNSAVRAIVFLAAKGK